RGTSTGGRPALYSLETFLEESFRAFRRAPLVALRNADGVKRALDALQFAEADFARAAMRARAAAADGEDAIFLTWHGRLLSTEIATNLLVQTLPWPEDADSVPAAVRMSLPPSEIMVTALSGGCYVLPADRPGCVHLRRTDRLLSAPKHDVTMQFSAETATDTEHFLTLPRKFLTALRALRAGNWREVGSQAYVPGAGVRLMPGFFLAVGDRRIELANAAFEFDPDKPAQLNIIAAGESVRLRRVGDAAGEVAVDHPADWETVPEAASMEQFRLAPGYLLRLRGWPELVHAPLTVDNAGRILVHASVVDGDEVRLGIQNYDISAIRAADKIVLLCPGAEGVIVDPAGRWSTASFPPGAKLPKGLAAHGGTVLIENNAWQNAPRLQTPHVVFYDPLAAGPDGPLRSAVALHALTAVMETGARLLLPSQFENSWSDRQGILQALGFSGIETTRVATDFVCADDLLFLSDVAPHAMPAGLLHSFRDRAHAIRPPSRAERRIYVKPKAGYRILRDELDQFLMKRDFDTVIAEELSETALPDAFAAASLVIAPHGPVLSNLLFCRPGTRVLELAPDKDPDPRFWLLSQKLGLFHAVLHCPLIDGRLRVARERFRAILQMLRAMDP
ncbi:MAG TPA: glycosyltransferase family 61 protein, partial [Acetobacteraceae bacterium]|nr:glycosyltransferase family 61 protein [Acetobacteraceae bacterium]